MGRKYTDLTGMTIRNYDVLERVEDHVQPSGVVRVMWKVKCKCGNIREMQTSTLTKGKLTYCEKCEVRTRPTRENLIGKKYNRLTVIKRVKGTPGGSKRVNYLCLCDCGEEVVVESGHMVSGHTKSCGCLQREQLSEMRSLDMLGVKMGKLTVDRFYENADGQNYWVCKCECGGEKILNARAINSGKTKSCGCISSVAEEELKVYLDSTDIEYKQQVKFEDCVHIRELAFDFGIYKDEKLLYLVELHGQQHYYPYTFCGEDKETKKENLRKLQHRDNIKKEYCKENGIKLLEISYKKFKLKEKLVHNKYNELAYKHIKQLEHTT